MIQPTLTTADVSATDKQTAVYVGELNQKIVIQKFVDLCAGKNPQVPYRFYDAGRFSQLDYVVADDDRFRCYVEAKVRPTKWRYTMIGTMKECEALKYLKQHDGSVKCLYLVYHLDTKELYAIDLAKPPAYRKWETRQDRNASDLYSYYDLAPLKPLFKGDL